MTTESVVTIIVSFGSLGISCIVAWFTLFRKGTTKMTQPTVIYLGPDGGEGDPKIFLRTLLYSTSHKGIIIENMFIKLKRGESQQNFNIWVYGDNQMARGSGLFVSHQGVVCNHHFLLPKDANNFEFVSGEYHIYVYASIVSNKRPILLHETTIILDSSQALEMKNKNSGIYFDWGPDSRKYSPHIDDPKIRRQNLSHILEGLGHLDKHRKDDA